MQCTRCLCSAGQETIINSVKYFECDFCGELVPTEESISNSSNDQREELKMLRVKLKEANDIIDSFKKSASSAESGMEFS
jgi:hypothetical protein